MAGFCGADRAYFVMSGLTPRRHIWHKLGMDPPPGWPELAPELAERMGIGYSTLKQWIRQGKVRTTQTAGGHHRMAEAEVDRLLAHHAPDAPAAARTGDRPAGLIVALSGRNQLRGFVEEVRIDGLLGQVRLRIGDQHLTAIITSDALSVLKLRRGDSALAIVKATDAIRCQGNCSPLLPFPGIFRLPKGQQVFVFLSRWAGGGLGNEA